MIVEIAVVHAAVNRVSPALDAAVTFAEAFGASIHPLIPIVIPDTAAGAMPLVPDPGFVELQAEMRLEAAQAAADLRRDLGHLAIDIQTELVESVGGDGCAAVAAAARLHDLTIMLGPNGNDRELRAHSTFVALLLGSGRPVLVTPLHHSIQRFPIRVLVAWSDSPASVRAVHDVMPALMRADYVELLVVNPSDTSLEAADEAGKGMTALLARHGVKATLTIRQGAVGATILAHAATTDADLIVAGGYGHRRIQEWLMGGTTRDLFFNGKHAVWFSH